MYEGRATWRAHGERLSHPSLRRTRLGGARAPELGRVKGRRASIGARSPVPGGLLQRKHNGRPRPATLLWKAAVQPPCCWLPEGALGSAEGAVRKRGAGPGGAVGGREAAAP